MKTDSRCATRGTPITPGAGHYDTPAGLYCLKCGIRIPIPAGVRVIVEIQDPEGTLNRYSKEATHHGK